MYRSMKNITLLLKVVFFILLFFSQSIFLLAQENQTILAFRDFLNNLQTAPSPGQGTIVIHQDSRLINQSIRLNNINSKKIGVAGYRINIYTGWGKDSRTKGDAENARFIAAFENIQTYSIYDPPRWVVYAGDFYTRSEAEKALQKIHKLYPKAFVRVARVKMPDLN